MQSEVFFASDSSNLVFILDSFFCPIGCHAGILSGEKISQFWFLMQFKKIHSPVQSQYKEQRS